MMWDIAGGIVMAVIILNLLGSIAVIAVEAPHFLLIPIAIIAVLIALLIAPQDVMILAVFILGPIGLHWMFKSPGGSSKLKRFNDWMESRRLGKRIV
jgi:hypothetical protein